jgi:hypothetical protein
MKMTETVSEMVDRTDALVDVARQFGVYEGTTLWSDSYDSDPDFLRLLMPGAPWAEGDNVDFDAANADECAYVNCGEFESVGLEILISGYGVACLISTLPGVVRDKAATRYFPNATALEGALLGLGLPRRLDGGKR